MRRRWLLVAGGTTLLGVGTAGAALVPDRTEAAPLPRLLSGPDWYDADPRAESAWLATGRVPGAAGPHGGLVRRALLDLRALTGPDGAVAAGPAPSWAYAWPRDSAFAAAALARTGHLDDADRILGFLSRVQLPDGGFEARYLLDGRGVPDGRRRQDDGAGWSLWALRAALDADPDGSSARDRAEEHRELLDGALEFTLDRTADGTRLPDPSPDYWELGERTLTLGAVAPLVAGLRAGAAVLSRLRERRRARAVSDAAGTLAAWSGNASPGRLDALRRGPAGRGRRRRHVLPAAVRPPRGRRRPAGPRRLRAGRTATGRRAGAGGRVASGRDLLDPRDRRSSRWPRRRAGGPRTRTPG